MSKVSIRYLAFPVAQILLILAFFLATWLSIQSLQAAEFVGCPTGSSCHQILNSQWSEFYNIPVALYGGLVYCLLLVTTQYQPFTRKAVGLLMATFCLIILGSAIWFMGLQIGILRQFCVYCCIVHGLASSGAVLMLYSLYLRSNYMPASISPIAMSFSLIAVLVLSQFFWADEPNVALHTTHKDNKAGVHDHPYFFNLVETHRGLRPSFPGATEVLPLDILKIEHAGNAAQSPLVLAYLFDWTCDHCRALHQQLTEYSYDARSLPIVPPVHVYMLPFAHNEDGRDIHHLMFALKSKAPQSYILLEQELYLGVVEPLYQPLLERSLELIGEDLYDLLDETMESFTQRLDLATAQVEYNQNFAGTNSLPQLFGLELSLSGVPDSEQMISFLQKTLATQNTTVPPRQMMGPRHGERHGGNHHKKKGPRKSESDLQLVTNHIEVFADRPLTKILIPVIVKGDSHLVVHKVMTDSDAIADLDAKQKCYPGEENILQLTFDRSQMIPGKYEYTVRLHSNARNFSPHDDKFKVKLDVIIPSTQD